MHVLHLIDDASPQATPVTLAWMAATMSLPVDASVDVDTQQHTAEALLLGGDELGQAARFADLPNAQRQHVPFGRAVAGFPAFARKTRGLQRPDLVHCWSVGSLIAAAIRYPLVPRLLTLTVWPTTKTARALRQASTLMNPRKLHLHVPHPSWQTQLTHCGFTHRSVHVLPPMVNPGLLDQAEPVAVLRERWQAEPEDRVVALLSHPTTAGNATTGVLELGIACLLLAYRQNHNCRHILLVHPQQRRRLPAEQMVREFGGTWRVVQDAELAAPWRVLPGADAAMVEQNHVHSPVMPWAPTAGCVSILETSPPKEDEPTRVDLVDTLLRSGVGLRIDPGIDRQWSHAFDRSLADTCEAQMLRQQAATQGPQIAKQYTAPANLEQSLRQIYAQCCKPEVVQKQPAGV